MRGRKSFVVGGMIAATVIAVLLIVGVTQAQTIKNQLYSWKIFPKPEKITELYFTYPASLPQSYTPNQKQVIAFTIHNLEYQTMRYHYTISESNTSGSQNVNITSGNYTLRQNGYVGVSIGEPIEDLGSRVKVSVKLGPVNETVSYWVEKE